MGYCYSAAVCRQGHVITERREDSERRGDRFCSICGSEIISKCRGCDTSIRGDYETPRITVVGFDIRDAPAFCHACGKPFPWTEDRLNAAKELADELDISDDEKTQLKAALDDITKEGPRNELGAARIKKCSLRPDMRLARLY